MTATWNASDRLVADVPALSVEQIQKMLAAELSPRARMGYVALLLVTLTMAVMMASLWVTEPSLPLRAHVAFGLMIGIALSWVTLAIRALTNRRILFASHRIVAAWMSVVFTAIFLVGMLVVALVDSGERAASAASLAAWAGGVMLAIALGLLVRARHQYARLQERRRSLEAALEGKRG